MPMRLKDYGRNRKERKEYIHQSGPLVNFKRIDQNNFDIAYH